MQRGPGVPTEIVFNVRLWALGLSFPSQDSGRLQVSIEEMDGVCTPVPLVLFGCFGARAVPGSTQTSCLSTQGSANTSPCATRPDTPPAV